MRNERSSPKPQYGLACMTERLLITGASSDLGYALARRLLSKDDQRSIIAHSFSGGSRILALREEYGERILPVQADFSDHGSVLSMINTIEEQFGVPQKIVHLPALRLAPERFTKFRIEHFRKDMSIQVEAPILLLKHFAAGMAKKPGARFVFVGSSCTHGMPPKFLSMYTIVKYAQLGLMRSAAADFASTHLTVNAVSPSMVETQFLSEMGETAVQMAAAANPQGRNATPEDVIGVIEFLLSSEAGFINGADLPITAGSIC